MKKNISKIISKKRKSLNNRIFYGLIFYFILAYALNKQVVIGKDWRYYGYFVILPVLIGLVFLVVFFRGTIREYISESKGFLEKVAVCAFMLLMGLFVSYLSFGTTATLVWTAVNRYRAADKKKQELVCEIRSFHSVMRSHSFGFICEGKNEKLPVTYRTIKPFLHETPRNYYIVLDARKGLWGCYVIDNYEVIRKDK
jgi:hypothetical protein